MRIFLPSWNLPRPGHDKWNVHAAFGQHSLLAVEWIVERAVPAGTSAGRIRFVNLERSAVVADVEDQCFLRETVFFERSGDQTNSVVDS